MSGKLWKQNGPVTTLMINNIPIDVRQKELLDLIDEDGFRGRYNFFFIPVNFREMTNQGIAFVNFRTNKDAIDFSRAWNGARLLGMGGAAPLMNISPSRTQGLTAIAAFSKKVVRVKDPALRPFIAD
jgi:protein phosphatase 1 regulatory subunit 42